MYDGRFEKFLEVRNDKIQAAAAEVLNLMGMMPKGIGAYEESLVIDEAESVLKSKGITTCYPYYGGDAGDVPCYQCNDCECQQEGRCPYLWLDQFVFTFGTESHFPFAFNEYVFVTADDEAEALSKFRKEYPDYHKDTVNCAFWYRAEDFFADGNHADMICKATIK